MAPIKRRPHARSQHKMKLRRRKPNIPELVYKFLRVAEEDGQNGALHSCGTSCRFCRRAKRSEELLNSVDSRRIGARSMANKQRRDSTRNPKSHGVKRHRTSKDKQHLSSCIHKCHGEDSLKKVKKYIQKALDFGVESGYLIPRDSTFKVLRVSSELMNGKIRRSRVKASERAISQERERSPHRTPTRFEDYQVQDARRRRGRRRRRRRSRSGSRRRRRRSRSRGRRRSRSQNPEEVAENDDDYEDELDNNNEKRNIRADDADRDPENTRINPPDGEKTGVKRNEDGSELSVDEDETDEEEERKREDTTKS